LKVNTKAAIEHVLKGKRKGMRVPEIIAAGVPLATNLKGRTPRQTFYSVLYSEAKKADGLVIQVDRGTFRLNPNRKKAAAAPAKATSRRTSTGKRTASNATKRAAAHRGRR
jgi:HB1, ASXL, restriction endonuclease HTH domain